MKIELILIASTTYFALPERNAMLYYLPVTVQGAFSHTAHPFFAPERHGRLNEQKCIQPWPCLLQDQVPRQLARYTGERRGGTAAGYK